MIRRSGRAGLLQKRNFMATLLLSEGVPMLAAGDELGRTQSGNNNAYCQDNQTSWIDWEAADRNFTDFVRQLIKLRSAAPVFRRTRFFDGGTIEHAADIMWRLPDGSGLAQSDWHAPNRQALMIEYRDGEAGADRRYLMLLNASSGPVSFRLPVGQLACAVGYGHGPAGG